MLRRSDFFYSVRVIFGKLNFSPKTMSGENKKTTLKRKFISLEIKIQILDRLSKGEKLI